MEKHEAETFIARLISGFDRSLSVERRAMYVERLQAWDYDIGRRAVNSLTDTEDHFPSIAKLLERCQSFAKSKGQPRVDQHSDPKMTPSEVQAAAELMATEAAARRSRHGGQADALCQLLERGAEVYSENARRRVQGRAELPRPQLRDILAGMAH